MAEIQIPHASPIKVSSDEDGQVIVEFDPEILGVSDDGMRRLELDPRRAAAFGEALSAEARQEG